MKKTLITTAVAFALAAPLSVFAQLVPPTVVPGNSAADDQFAAIDNTTDSDGSVTAGPLSPSINTAIGSYSPSLVGSQLTSINNGYNDVNSDNSVTIGEDGTVAFAQDLDQAIAASDLSHLVGAPLNVLGVGPGNNVIENSVLNVGAQNPAPNSGLNNNWTKTNAISGGAFNNYGGIASASQNAGSTTAVGQSIVVQSNGSL